MSTGIDIEFVRERYANMSDEELIYFIRYDGGGLAGETLEIIKAEVVKRGLDMQHMQLSKTLDKQNKTYTEEEVAASCEIIRSLDCPICYKKNEPLNAVRSAEVISFILVTQSLKKVHIGCKDCLDKTINKSLGKTILLGWWGFPWGIIRTIEAISINLKSKHFIHVQQDVSDELLREFAIDNMELINAHKGNMAGLQEIFSIKK